MRSKGKCNSSHVFLGDQIKKTIEGYFLCLQVNSAGIVEVGSIETTSLEQYDHVMNINTRYK